MNAQANNAHGEFDSLIQNHAMSQANSNQNIDAGQNIGAGQNIAAIAPISLAYIGDAVFELYVRSQLLMPAKRIRDYHQLVVTEVNAEQQSHYVDILTPHLSEDELDLLRRGRNATTGRHRRASGQDYQKATGFEALLGFLYLKDQTRLLQLLKKLEITGSPVPSPKQSSTDL